MNATFVQAEKSIHQAISIMIETESAIPVHRVKQSRVSEVDFENLGFGKEFSDHMFIADYRDGQWGDLRIVPFAPFTVHPAMSALHYGQSIFEGLKAFKNDKGEIFIFRPDKNAERLNKSADRMCMPEFPPELFIQAVTALVDIDQAWVPSKEGEALYIRPLMFATDAYVGIRPSDTYRLMIFTGPVGRYYTGDVKVKIENIYTRASKGGTGNAKAAGNYAASLYPAKKAREEGFDQMVWTDATTHEYIEESGTMNILFRHGNRIITPMITDSILEGITRDSVLTLARDWGYQVEERKVSVIEIIDLLRKGELHEAFGAGTAATVAPIAKVGYKGESFSLPPYETWEFAPKARAAMDSIKRGIAEDVHHWNVRVK